MDNVMITNSDLPLAMAYAPEQEWNEVYEIDTAFCRGTIFPGLDKPFLGREVRNGR